MIELIVAFLIAMVAGIGLGMATFWYMTSAHAANLSREPNKEEWAGYTPTLYLGHN